MPLNLLSSSATASISRKNQQSVFRSGGPDLVPILKQNLIRYFILRLTGQITVAGASNTVANTQKGDEWACITRFRLVANGTDVLFDGAGDDLWWLNRLVYGARPRITPAIGDGATANPSFDSSLMLPVWLLRGRKPMDGAYETFRVNNLQAEVTYGAFTTINSAATAYTTPPSLEISACEVEPTPSYVPPFITRTYKQVQDYGSAQSAGRFILDTGPYYRGLLINISANGGGNDSAGVLTNLKVVAGSTVLRDLSGPALLAAGELTQSIDPGIEIDSTNIARQTRLRVSQGSDGRAWYYVNFCEDGSMTEAIQTPTANDLYLELALTGAARVSVIGLQLFPNPAAAPQN